MQAYQNLRSAQAKALKIQSEAQRKVEQAESKVNALNKRLKEATEKSQEDLRALKADLTSQEEKVTHLEGELSKARSDRGSVAMSVGMYFGVKSRIEIMEEYEAGKHSEWDLAAAKAEFEKDYPDGCPHHEYLEEAGLVGDGGEEVSSGRTGERTDQGDERADGDTQGADQGATGAGEK